MKNSFTSTIRQVKKGLLVLGVALVSINASAAGFHCGKATEVVEKIICGSQELSDYDSALNREYEKAIRSNPINIKRIKREQLVWLKQRNLCEYSFDCLKSVYQERLQVLRANALPVHKKPYSWGGKIREQPNLSSRQVGSTINGQTIKILRPTNVAYNGYQWFEVEVDSVRGFQWGGILCAPEYSSMSYCEQ